MDEMDLETGQYRKRQIPIYEWYTLFDKNILSRNDPAGVKYKEELFGPASLDYIPEGYSDYSFYKAVGVTEVEYKSYDLHIQARMRAYYILNNLVELREAHLKLMKQKNEDRQRRLEAQHKAKTGGKKGRK